MASAGAGSDAPAPGAASGSGAAAADSAAASAAAASAAARTDASTRAAGPPPPGPSTAPDSDDTVARCAWLWCNASLKAGDTKRCTRCRRAVYCSKTCQVRAWKHGHKLFCYEAPELLPLDDAASDGADADAAVQAHQRLIPLGVLDDVVCPTSSTAAREKTSCNIERRLIESEAAFADTIRKAKAILARPDDGGVDRAGLMVELAHHLTTWTIASDERAWVTHESSGPELARIVDAVVDAACDSADDPHATLAVVLPGLRWAAAHMRRDIRRAGEMAAIAERGYGPHKAPVQRSSPLAGALIKCKVYQAIALMHERQWDTACTVLKDALKIDEDWLTRYYLGLALAAKAAPKESQGSASGPVDEQLAIGMLDASTRGMTMASRELATALFTLAGLAPAAATKHMRQSWYRRALRAAAAQDAVLGAGHSAARGETAWERAAKEEFGPEFGTDATAAAPGIGVASAAAFEAVPGFNEITMPGDAVLERQLMDLWNDFGSVIAEWWGSLRIGQRKQHINAAFGHNRIAYWVTKWGLSDEQAVYLVPELGMWPATECGCKDRAAETHLSGDRFLHELHVLATAPDSYQREVDYAFGYEAAKQMQVRGTPFPSLPGYPYGGMVRWEPRPDGTLAMHAVGHKSDKTERHLDPKLQAALVPMRPDLPGAPKTGRRVADLVAWQCAQRRRVLVSLCMLHLVKQGLASDATGVASSAMPRDHWWSDEWDRRGLVEEMAAAVDDGRADDDSGSGAVVDGGAVGTAADGARAGGSESAEGAEGAEGGAAGDGAGRAANEDGSSEWGLTASGLALSE